MINVFLVVILVVLTVIFSLFAAGGLVIDWRQAAQLFLLVVGALGEK